MECVWLEDQDGVHLNSDAGAMICCVVLIVQAQTPITSLEGAFMLAEVKCSNAASRAVSRTKNCTPAVKHIG